MAATVASVKGIAVPGDISYTVNDVTMDASYPTGGLAVTARQLGLSRVLFSIAEIRTTAAAGNAVDAVYDSVNAKVKLNAAAAEVANASNTTGLVVRVAAFGYP